MIIQLIFWVSAFALLHTYFIYPLFIKKLAAKKKSNPIVYSEKDEWPTLSVIIPAYNEEAVIKEKIESIYQSYYPIDKLEVFIGSDASTDKTNLIVQNCQKKYRNLHLIVFPGRNGKPSIVNQLVTQAKNEILLLTDANIMLDPKAIFEMVKYFKDPEIALVDSNMQHKGLKKEGISRQEKTYIEGEVEIKNAEGKIWGSMIGPFGGCYTLRKSFYTEVPSNSLVDDFYINMKVLEKGGKTINETNALVYEDVSSILKEEFRRKIRIATGNFQNLFRFAHLLFRFNAVSFCFLSHKVLRWLGPFFILLTFTTNLYLVYTQILHHTNELSYFVRKAYLFSFWGHCIIFTMPLLDFILNKVNLHPLLPRLVSHFLTMNLALLIGFFRFLGGVKSGIWTPTQRNQ